MNTATTPSAPSGARSLDDLAKTVSASRLGTWLACRLKFWFRYVAGITKPRTAALFVGHAVHGALKLWNQARWRRQVLSAEDLKQRFDALWLGDQRTVPVQWDTDEDPGEKQTAWSLLDLYLRETPIPPNERPEGVEVSVEADLSAHGLPRLIGILDLVRAGGHIVDFKTVGQTPSEEKAIHNNEVQLSAYAVLYREATGKTEGGRELHQLVKLKTPKFILTRQGPMTEPQRTRLFKQIESYAAGLSRQDFVPSPGMQCSMCPFMPECRLWS